MSETEVPLRLGGDAFGDIIVISTRPLAHTINFVSKPWYSRQGFALLGYVMDPATRLPAEYPTESL